jgi:hypothetical protein
MLKTWLKYDLRQEYTDAWMEQEVFAGEVRCCNECTPEQCTYRCKDCFGGTRMSGWCMAREHKRLPLHNIEVCWSAPHVSHFADCVSGMERRVLRTTTSGGLGCHNTP